MAACSGLAIRELWNLYLARIPIYGKKSRNAIEGSGRRGSSSAFKGILPWRGSEICDSLPPTENRSHHQRTAATVKHSNHEEGPFIGRVGDEVIAHRLKTNGARG